MRYLSALLLSLIVLVLGMPVAGATSEPDSLEGGAVDSFVGDYLDRHGLAGASVAIVKDGQVVHTAGYGDTGDEPVTADTPMSTGSVGKSITAFAVLQLVDAGEVGLDDPVVEHLPEFELDDPRASEITVRQLLSHTSGLPNPTIVPPADNLTEGVAFLHDWQLDADPEERYAYSNANYWVAGRLVEEVSGTEFASYLDEHIFGPLGMDDTRTVNTTRADDPGLQHGHVTAYGLALPLREMEQLLAGSGGVVTTAEDMARWLTMLTDRARTPEGAQLLSSDLLEEAQSPQPGSDGYGLGWQISGPNTEPARVGHSGATSRYSAQLDLVPSSGYGVAVMLNSYTSTYEHNYAISAGIIEITEGGSPTPGTPVTTLVDAGLGLLTLLVLALTVVGIRRAGRWSARRAAWPGWRYALRLLPQLVFPALVVLVFLVVPRLQDNSATPLDLLGFWPAAMALLLVLGASGVVLAIVRVRRRYRDRTPDRRPAPVVDSASPVSGAP